MKNKVKLTGQILSRKYSHELNHEKFYVMIMEVYRTSGRCDRIPIQISERIMINENRCTVTGRIRCTCRDGHMKFYIAASSMRSSYDDFMNEVSLEGFLCDKFHRINYDGIDICRFIIANNNYKTSYIPCVAFNQNAVYINRLNQSDCITLNGRIEERRVREKSVFEIATYRIIV